MFDNILLYIKAYQETSLRNQIKLKQEVFELKQLLFRFLLAVNSVFLAPDESPKWPLVHEDEIHQANEYLQDDGNFA